jgi:hypothetical protein
VLRAILRKEWIAGVAFVALFVVLRGIAAPYPMVESATVVIVYGVVVFMLLRCDLMALVAAIFITDLVPRLAFTTHFSAWYGSGSSVLVVLVSALAIFAFRKALGGQGIGAALLDQ